MNCPECGYNCEQHNTAASTFRRCLRVGCDWSETVPAAGRKRAHRELPGGDTGRLREVQRFVKDLHW